MRAESLRGGAEARCKLLQGSGVVMLELLGQLEVDERRERDAEGRQL